MNKGALSLYVQACRQALESNLVDSSSWTGGLDTSLLHLRQALTCSVCGRLLEVPMGPPESVCQHYVCRGCIGGKTRFIKRTCGWCKEHATFVPNAQLLSLVLCFRRLCQYLKTYLTPEPGPDASTNPTEFIIREAAIEIGQDTSPGGLGSKNSNRPLSPHFVSPLYVSPIFVSTSQPELDLRLDDTNISNNSITTDRKDEERGSVKKRKRKFDSLGKVEDLGPSTSLSSPNRSSQLRSSGFSPQSPRPSAQSSPCYAAVVTDRSYEAGESSERIEGENEGRSYVSDNVVLSEHDYNKNLLSTPNNTISGGGLSGAATVPSRGRFANRSDICRRNKKSNAVVVVADRTSTSFVENGSVAKKVKPATIRQIVEANQFQVSDASLSNEDERAISSPTNRSEGHVGLSKSKNISRTGCRCAMSKPNPGKLTCCGQRCPCYSAFKGCVDCKCRGCRNPRGDPRRIPATVHTIGSHYSVGEIMKRSPTHGVGDLVGRVTLT